MNSTNTLDLGAVRFARSISPDALLAIGRVTLGVGALALGAIGLVFGDFALQWQPVPESVPGRMLFAYATAIVLAALGAGLLIERVRGLSSTILSAVFFIWAFALQTPRVLAAPGNVLSWLGFCEITAVASGTLALAAALSEHRAFARWGALAARFMFGACLPVFGFSHFVSIPFTSNMIPAWMPFRVFWAWFTGAGHVAAGASILSGVLARLGSLMLAIMVSGFVLLLHIPRIIAEPASRVEWTMTAMATVITGAAWCIAGSIASQARR
jgi:uncharacterized membrane protein YphA (DoxX/SURF4 family)